MKIGEIFSKCEKAMPTLVSWACILAFFGIPMYFSSPDSVKTREKEVEMSARLTKRIEVIVAGEDRIISPTEARRFLDLVGYRKPICEQDRISFYQYHLERGAFVYKNGDYLLTIDLKTLEMLTNDSDNLIPPNHNNP